MNIACVLSVCCIVGVLACPTYAEEYTFSFDDRRSVEKSFDELLSALPEDLRNELDSVSLDDTESTVKALREKTNLGAWLRKIFAAVEDALPSIIPSFVPMFSLILLMTGAQAALPDSPALKKTFIEFAGLFAAVEVFRLTASVVDIVRNYLDGVCKVMNCLVPVLEAVCLFGGKITEKAVTGGGILLLITLLGNFNNVVLVPLTYLLFTLSTVTMTCQEVKLGGMVSGLRKFIMRLWSIMGILLSFMLGIQNILAKSADNLASRTAKFAIGSFIPVAGGLLSEAFSTVQEGMAFIRQAAGIGGILLILAILLPGIIPLALYKLALSITASAAELLGVTSVVGLFTEIRGIVEFLLAVVLVTTLLFLLALMLFMKTQTV